MSRLFLYLLIIILPIIEASVWRLNFDLMLFLVWLLTRSAVGEVKYAFPFWLGIVFDLVLGRVLGLTSLVFLVFAFLWRRYTLHLDLSNRNFMVILLPILSLAFSRFQGQESSLILVFFELALSWFSWPYLAYLLSWEEEGEQLRLRI